MSIQVITIFSKTFIYDLYQKTKSKRQISHVLRMNIFPARFLWKEEEASRAKCFFHVLKILENWNLRECQALCEAKREEECVGIAYSHNLHYSHHCYLCFADILLVSDNEFGFYRRPGIFEVYFHG